ncbi:Asp-tRNA(Asn)/Glu-tRNA(Gln) amidotransferase subunit GatC [Candidatus Dependentiae bacterium]|nr:MAG: Asp-tRNA(Asn)/Glu-tRNA(Gln) amidotransferase subunit GatC [Candidatus Dependentiae bacterium]
MTQISREEILKIAGLSKIELPENEIDVMSKQLQDVLTYAHCVCDIAAEIILSPQKNINVFREDVISPNDAQLIMTQAPESVQNYFVVPIVLEVR